MDVLINPNLDEVRPALLGCLNRCFPHWGGDDDYWWHLVRIVGRKPTDVMLIRDAGRFVAGSAVVYRPVVLGDGRAADVGIMASSWTLPEARGQGHFTRIIEESVRLARGSEAALLVAYVTSVNASSRRLLASGAAAHPTHYLIDEHAPTPSPDRQPVIVEAPEASLDEIMNVSAGTPRSARFSYRPDEWRGQFWKRPNRRQLVRVGEIGTAVIETKNEFDRLLAFSRADAHGADCLGPLLAWSHARGQKFFFFTTDDVWRDRAVRLGMRHLPGLFTMRGAIEETGPSFAGPWFIQGGDRM